MPRLADALPFVLTATDVFAVADALAADFFAATFFGAVLAGAFLAGADFFTTIFFVAAFFAGTLSTAALFMTARPATDGFFAIGAITLELAVLAMS